MSTPQVLHEEFADVFHLEYNDMYRLWAARNVLGFVKPFQTFSKVSQLTCFLA